MPALPSKRALTADPTWVPVATLGSLTLAWEKKQQKPASHGAELCTQPVQPHGPRQVRVCSCYVPQRLPWVFPRGVELVFAQAGVQPGQGEGGTAGQAQIAV